MVQLDVRGTNKEQKKVSVLRGAFKRIILLIYQRINYMILCKIDANI